MSSTPALPRSFVSYDDVTEIRNRLGEFTSAFNRGDVDVILQTYTPDAVVLPPDRPAVKGIAGIRQLWESLLATGYCNVAFELDRIECWGDVAIALGRYKVQILIKPGTFETDRGKCVCHWRRAADGQFRITSGVWYSDRWHSTGQR